MNINVGGGKFLHRGWLNLDGRAGFDLTQTCTFPLDNAEIVYSSHCLEHLDDATVDRVLSEARRVGKTLVLKLPDFDQILERLHAEDEAYFDQWGLKDVIPTWKRRGVAPTIWNKAAMLFCGWWNDEYGNEWGKRYPDRDGAYHGPAIASESVWDLTPHNISAALKANVPQGAHLNHQNAWSRTELTHLVRRHGFDIQSIDAEEICEMDIPGIEEMYDISMYLKAV
jgi:hypothetical protein